MLAPLLGAVGSLAGTAASLWQGNKNREAAEAHALRQEALQREFAQNGISWKVADAERAGIHPLFALGASTQSYSPTTVGSTSTDFSGLSDAGQNIGRAIDATRNVQSKQAAALQTAAAVEDVKGKKLDNALKAQQVASAIATTPPSPGVPAPHTANGQWDGQGNAISLDGPKIEVETKRDVTDPRNPAYVPGSGPGAMAYKNPTGGYSVAVPPGLAESFDGDPAGALDWFIRNRLLPYLSPSSVTPPRIPHDPITEEVYFSRVTGDYRIRKKQYGPWQNQGTPPPRHWPPLPRPFR